MTAPQGDGAAIVRTQRIRTGDKRHPALCLSPAERHPIYYRHVSSYLIKTELDAVGRQFEPCPYCRMRLHARGALVVLPGMLFPNSRGIYCGLRCESEPELVNLCVMVFIDHSVRQLTVRD